MVDPYEKSKILLKDIARIFHEKNNVEGRISVVLNHSLTNRGLKLINTPSRALKKYEIHELIGTGEEASPGSEVKNVWYLGFFEVEKGGVITCGDSVWVNNRKIGEVIGYDETHMPNHLNIVIKLKELKTGAEFGIKLNDRVVIGRTL
ncbi:hypothetical protein [Thermococcus sp.]|uniref:DUF6917 domain-containing protein n=1 Tax=Thermococcus sp. TaxID=35749 RepID=UPI00262AF627|nr:hypothetical protein [Thermococcus sp.]MCD6144190.1 hypothetical protein [Thermococcus sp.]